jgi:hypothetical protein
MEAYSWGWSRRKSERNLVKEMEALAKGLNPSQRIEVQKDQSFGSLVKRTDRSLVKGMQAWSK